MATVAKATISEEAFRQVLAPGGGAKFKADLSMGKTTDVIEQHKEPFAYLSCQI